MDPDVPPVDVDTGQGSRRNSAFSDQQHHLPPSSLLGTGGGEGRCRQEGGGLCASLHLQSTSSVPVAANDTCGGEFALSYVNQPVTSSGNNMTPEEGQDVAAVVDLQRVPERPQSSSRTPCPNFTKCDSCGQEFETTNHYLEHVCEASRVALAGPKYGQEGRSCLTPSFHLGIGGRDRTDGGSCATAAHELSDSSTSDVENFTGKIVYNPDGSAFILETGDSEFSDDECSLDLSHSESTVTNTLRGATSTSQPINVIPQMVNALHIARNPAFYSALYGQAYSFLHEKNKVPEVPVMHSFRVFTVRDKASETNNKEDSKDGSHKRPSSLEKANFPMVDYSSVPIKPILMCFMCKLSFGYAKSFVAHAMGEHNISLNEEEKRIMSQKNTSAIIQGVGKEKEPLLSFLEPIPSSSAQESGSHHQGSVFAQSLQSSCTSSFGSSDPVTTLLNTMSGAVAMSYGSCATTTLVSANSSPVAALSEIKPAMSVSSSRSEMLTTPALMGTTSSLLVGSDNEEALAPELQDLVTIEKMAKAAAAAAEADSTPRVSPMGAYREQNSKPGCLNGQGGSDTAHDEQDPRLNAFDFSTHTSGVPAVSTSSLERPISTGSRESMSPGARVSPKNIPIPSPLCSTVPSPTPNTSSPVCVCSQHPDGRTNGVECPKCDLILGSSRSLGGHMTMMHSRNSCKTLKCPKCNWHYKYQETLEIHMKEKHPENDLSCIYCLTNQPHPRLARGETYTCGYKPYRCEVCNYSTTTKGNLSIHMQSDKHINNVQELQNGNLPTDHVIASPSMPAPPPMSNPNTPDSVMKKPIATSKPKATWRCDVCNYETNVARNLRIHMTSEKHNHNMMVLQQNVKHMQQLSAFQQAQAQAQAQAMDPLFQFHPGLLLPCDSQLQPEAALADMAYNHALLMMATQQQQQRAMAAAAAAAAAATGKSGPMGAPLNLSVPPTLDLEHPDPSLRPDIPYDEKSKLFQCCVCHVYSADNIEILNQHAQMDRTRQREEEVLMVVAGTYICKLCTYKTNLKANFQLHCKTDKHLQRLQHVNHVKEGGPSTEWKLKYANVSNPVQVRCNACDYYTNSIHKLQLHTANPRHEANSRIFSHLQIGEKSIKSESHYYHCKLCNFSTKAKFNLIQHVHSIRHLRHENLRQLQLRSEGRDINEDLRDYLLVRELKGNENIIFDADVDTPLVECIEDETPKAEGKAEPFKPEERPPSASKLKKALTDQSKSGSDPSAADQQHQCPFCNYTSTSEVRIQMHVVSQHSPQSNTVPCPLCQEGCKDLGEMESHLVDVHNVTKEGVQRLLLMVDLSNNGAKQNHHHPGTGRQEESVETSKQETPETEDKSATESKEKVSDDGVDDLNCLVCNKNFSSVDELFCHQNEVGHMELKSTPAGPGYLCWKKGCTQYFKTLLAVQTHFKEIHAKKPLLAVSDRHVYKYRCNQCSLAFKTLEKLQLHSQYHLIRAATKCVLCGRSFRSVIALQKHVETSHTDMTKEQLEQYKASLANNPLLISGGGGVLDPQTTELLKKESIRDETDGTEDAVDVGADKDEGSSPREVDCDQSEVGEPPLPDGMVNNQDFLEDYINSQTIAEDSYNDPNRKYKCHRCKVAFTRQSYLTSHNKTLLHRKGEKMSYPMEKYLDPNRPFKCDICMESFTQKNILLVHYNSVSHLHKLKLSMKDSNNSNNNNNNNNNTSSCITINSTASTSSTVTSVTPSSCSSSTSSSSPTASETEKKPFKCNICKVSYTQGSTLDIHVRSVLHQTRASKLHELAITGQVDLSCPLIERPEQSQTEQVQQPPTMSNESSSLMLPQTTQVSGLATSVPSVQAPKIPDLSQVPLSTSVSPGAAPITSASPKLHLPTDAASMAHALGLTPPVPQPPVLLPSQVSSQTLLNCQRCSAIFMSQEALLQHQQLCCFFNQPSPSVLGRSTPGTSPVTPQPPPPSTPVPPAIAQTSNRTLLQPKEEQPLQAPQLQQQQQPQTQQQKSTHVLSLQSPSEAMNPPPPELSPQLSAQHIQLSLKPKCPFPRPRPLVYKHLIESFGFDIVMQFNEFNQKRKKSEKKETESIKLENQNMNCENPDQDKSCDIKNEEESETAKDENEKKRNSDLPEINRSVCHICAKEFSSIWVLKAHREEIHKEIVPFEFLEKFSDSFRIEYDKRHADQVIHISSEDSVTELNPPTPSVSAEPAMCPTPSSVSSSSQIPVSVTPPSTSLSSQVPDVAPSVAANQMATQLQFNQLLMSMGLGMGLPMGMNLNMPFAAAAAMNLHPPLIPVLLPPPLDPMMASAFNHPMMSGGVDSNFFAVQQKLMQQQQQQQAVAAAAAVAAAQSQQQKRARTRISDEQLKILRTYFDINNSPTEEQLMEMSEKSGLPLKVIKHWFRNTLFKERQRNKDSPYNFNNPPSTYLNLEEYEKTGEAKVVSLDRNDFLSKADADSTNQSEDGRCSIVDDTDSSQEDKSKNEAEEVACLSEEKHQENKTEAPLPAPPSSIASESHPNLPSVDLIPVSYGSRDDSCRDLQILCSEPSSPTSQPSINFSSVTSITTPLIPSASCSPPTSDSPRAFGSPSYCGTPTSTSGSGSGKRANRTRFTDYQIKVLQEFFESNAYPKDDDLEYLSKLLNLSPRVIVVWFQNARQKARKVYENQPPITADEDSAGRFQRTPGLNYQCKKCLQVFQRYYELIKHQKSSCFKDENPIAVQMKAASNMDEKSQGSVPDSTALVPRTPEKFGQNGTYRCDKCSLAFQRFDLWREHQIVHIMNPNLFPNYSPNSSFGILQYEAQQPPTPPLKRKMSEEEEAKDITDQPRDKRLRTTILPEQLDYLYQKYQIESNPSRKMLENIAREVGLKKRVVQVWFQNTRARERKGQFRAHQQVIHKRCPFCRALFKARSALESHLATRHADQYTRGDINIDSLPDGDIDSNPETPSTSNASEDVKNTMFPPFQSVSTTASSSAFPTQTLDSVQNTIKKYYEDSLKKYIDELSSSSSTVPKENTTPADLSVKNVKASSEKSPGHAGDTPLDLSKPVKINVEGDKSSDCLPTNLSDRSAEDAMNRSMASADDARSETHSESTDNMDVEDASHESNPTSPSSSLQRSSSSAGKRFRTQMTTMQLKVMKSIFADYKTPSMAECESLGREIGLPKRVVQVWFQNARAKEKKAKLAFLKAFGQEMEMAKLPEECTICNVKYNVKFSNTSMQDHLFSKRHLDNLKSHINQMKKLTEGQDSIDRHDLSPGTPGSVINQLVQSQQAMQEDSERAGSAISGMSQPSLMQQLQMMGLPTMPGMPLPVTLPGFTPPGGNSTTNSSNPNGVNSGSSSGASVPCVGALGSPTLPTSSSSTCTAKDEKLTTAIDKDSKTTALESTDNKQGEVQQQSHPQQQQPPQNPSSSPPTTTATVTSLQRKEDKKDNPDLVNGGTSLNVHQTPPSQRLGAMTDFTLPTSEAGSLFPYMYAGFPGYYAGLPGTFFHPGMYPGRNKL